MLTKEQRSKRNELRRARRLDPEVRKNINEYMRKYRKNRILEHHELKEKKATYLKNYRSKHPEQKKKHVAYIRKRYLQHPELLEKRKNYKKSRRLDPKIKEHNKEYRKNYKSKNYEKLKHQWSERNKKIRLDPILKNNYNTCVKKYRADPNNKIKIKLNQKKYYKSLKGKETKKRLAAKRRREMGFVSLNPLFKNCNSHHLDKNNVINVPEELHTAIWHKQSDNESMNKINILAWDFLESQAY